MADDLKELEKRISIEYTKAEAELKEKYEAHMKAKAPIWEKEHKAMLAKEAGYQGKTDREAEQLFKAWELSYLGRGEHWNELKDQMASRLVESKEIATGYINGALPSAYAKASNSIASIAQASAMDQGVTGIRFDLVDENTVRDLMMQKGNRISFKTVSANPQRQYKWDAQRIQSALLQGILQGDSIEHMADRFFHVMEADRKSAVRNARTAVTSARNAGKQDRYNDLADQGCEITKIWIATEDDRTRGSHMEMHGVEIPYNQPFEVYSEELEAEEDMMFPCDPSATACNVYNCRCTMKTGKIRFHSVLSKEQQESANIRLADENPEPIIEEVPQTVEEAVPLVEENVPPVEEPTKDEAKDYSTATAEALGEAYNYHQEANGMSGALFSDLDSSSWIKADFGSMDSEIAQAYSEALIDLSNRYDTTLQEIRIMSKDEYIAKSGTFAFTYHDYSVDKSTIVFNVPKLSDYDKHMERMEELRKQGYFVPIPEGMIDKYIATHEFAHTLVDMGSKLDNKRNWLHADYDKVRSVRKEINAVYDQYMSEVGKLIEIQKATELRAMETFDKKDWEDARKALRDLESVQISKYAHTNADEFMAECFTLAELSDTDNPYASKIKEIIDRNYGR